MSGGIWDLLARWSRRARSSWDPAAGLDLSDADVAELTALERQVEQEYRATSTSVIRANLARLRNRRVPVRGVLAAGVRGMARVRFADGTVVFVEAFHRGDLGELAVRATMQPIRFEAFHTETDRVILEFAWDRRRISVVAVGLEPAM